MDDPPSLPLVFANRVIRQFVDHLLGGLVVKPRDYLVMRVVFRKRGGNWLAITQGNIQQIQLLEEVVTSWGKLPGREQDVPEDV